MSRGEDLKVKEELGATKFNIVTVGIFENYHAEPNSARASITKEGLQLIGTRVYMKNSRWPNNCDLTGYYPADKWIYVGASSPNGLGWSSTGPIVDSGDTVSIEFRNWSDCNRRGGKLVVYLK